MSSRRYETQRIQVENHKFVEFEGEKLHQNPYQKLYCTPDDKYLVVIRSGGPPFDLFGPMDRGDLWKHDKSLAGKANIDPPEDEVVRLEEYLVENNQ